MAHGIVRIAQPELFIGFVAPIGTDIRASINSFSNYFKAEGYNVVPIKVTEVFDRIAPFLPPKKKLVQSPEARRLETYIKYGNQLRATFDDDQVLAAITIKAYFWLRTFDDRGYCRVENFARAKIRV